MSDTDTANKKGGLTARDQEIIIAALRNVKGGELQIDYHGLAKALGLKDNKSATSTWCTVKKKLGIQPATPTEAKPKTPSKPKEAKATTTPKSSKKVTSAPAATEVDGDETDEIDGGSSATDLKHESEEGEVDAQDVPTTPKVSGTTAAVAPSTGKKRGRKSKAEKEAEASADGAETADGDAEKPAKKPRKTPVKKKTAATATTGDDAEPKTLTKAKKATPARKPAASKASVPAEEEDATADDETTSPVKTVAKVHDPLPVKGAAADADAGAAVAVAQAVKEEMADTNGEAVETQVVAAVETEVDGDVDA